MSDEEQYFRRPSNCPTEMTFLLAPVSSKFPHAATSILPPINFDSNSRDVSQIHQPYGTTSASSGNHYQIVVASGSSQAEGMPYPDASYELPYQNTGETSAYNQFDQNSDPLQFSILETSLDPICILSPKGRILCLSNHFFQSCLYANRLDIPKDHFASFLHPSDKASLVTGLREVLRTGSVEMILRLRNIQGSYEWFDFQGTLSERSNQKQVMLHGRRKELVKELLMQEFTNIQLQMQCTIPWFQLSRTGIILYASANACDFIENNHSRTRSIAIDELCETPSKKDLSDLLSRVVASSTAVCLDHMLLCRSGAQQRVHSTIVNSAPASGTSDFIIMYIHMLGNGGNGPRAKPQLASCSCGTQYLGVSDGVSSTLSLSRFGSVVADDIIMRSTLAATLPYLPRCLFTSPGKPTSTRGSSLHAPLSHYGGPSTPSMIQQPHQQRDLNPATSSSAFFVLYGLQQQNTALQAEVRTLERRQKRRKQNNIARLQGMKKGGCAHCGRIDTPEWRRGPNGKHELCNRCGLKWAKGEKTKVERSMRRRR